MTYETIKKRIEVTLNEVLPLVQIAHPYVTPWELRGVVYDNAMKASWRKYVKEPFIDNANAHQLRRVYQAALDLKAKPELWPDWDKKSKLWRSAK
jgi:hypothetical protein